MTVSSKLKATTKNEFSVAVEKKAVAEGISHLEAIAYVMAECHIQPEDCAKFINVSLKAKLMAEALQNRMIRGQLKGGDNVIDKQF